MDKIYSAQDVANVIAKVEELAVLNAELEELLYRGSNDEKLVDRKRELEKSVRKYKPIVEEVEEPIIEEVEDEELTLLKEKMQKIDKSLLDELNLNHNFIKSKIFENLFNLHNSNEFDLENLIGNYDKNNVGFLNENQFNSMFDEILVLSDNEKNIILQDLERNHNGKFSTINFIDKIKNFNKDSIKYQIKQYNHFYNDYIIKLRNFFD